MWSPPGVPRSTKFGGNLRREGDVLVINVDGAPTRRRSLVMLAVAVVAISALVWVGSIIQGDDVTVLSSSVTRSDPFGADTSSTGAPSTSVVLDTTTTLPIPIDAADSVPDTTVPAELAQSDLPAVLTVVPPVPPVTPTTTAPARKKKKSTTTTPAPFPPGFNLPVGFNLPPGYVAPTAPQCPRAPRR